MSLFADDTAVFTYSTNFEQAAMILQSALNFLQECFLKWKTKSNPRKTLLVVLGRERRPSRTRIVLDGHELEWSSQVIPRRSKLGLRQKLNIYIMAIRPISLYASVVWGHTAKSHITRLQTLQNKITSSLQSCQSLKNETSRLSKKLKFRRISFSGMQLIMTQMGCSQLFRLNQIKERSTTRAAPSIEACPPDSVLSADVCKCDPSLCRKPPCPTELRQATNASEVPGQCCPTYECSGCKKEEEIAGKCPCAPGAVIEGDDCVCVDREKRLVDGKCLCNFLQCPLPQICDKKSVAVTVTGECCNTVICKPCPFDSESTNLETDELEDHCVCLPCKTDCGNNRTAVIKKHGSGFPGNCCDLYECKKPESVQGCIIGDVFYENGKEWQTEDLQICRCNNGLSLCSKTKDKEAQSCFVDNKLYKDNEKWTKEDGCTECTCKDGLEQCISHFCDVKETHIQKNHSCFRQDRIYQPSETWLEKDGCTKCTCANGTEQCVSSLCDPTTTMKTNECQPLANCNTTCSHGYKINKKGCEVCRCSNGKISQDLLIKYNISLTELIKILDDFRSRKTSTVAPETSTRAAVTVDGVVDRFGGASTTTEPSVVPTDDGRESWVYIAIAVLAFGIFIIAISIMCIYKSRRKSSIDLTHCQYHTVNNLNNNTIKKTDQLL
ncbi:unnamed protein product [Phaedon cochleariae]|uniref:Antistasin-like domain-containing protein n=1 Tax=Phaedon cochleariae TaxID=80249 RepID=A0A9P0DBJ2_PHACE|nr:unnamed protein product [Phaedon cochleariae]